MHYKCFVCKDLKRIPGFGGMQEPCYKCMPKKNDEVTKKLGRPKKESNNDEKKTA